MSSTDDRVVNMKFNNAEFKKNALDTKKDLADVNTAMDSAGKNKGLLNLNSQMGTVGVTASKMAIVTTTALATIANKVVNVGLNMVKALTFDPIKAGFSEYEALLTKQNTIMNATGLSAQKVKKYLNELNVYSDKTIYSFGNMSESIMKFVNAGVPLKEAVGTVKGIANAAAYAGASTNDANRAMFAFGQSISNGFLTLGDFNQVESANMATVQFKQTLLDSAVAAGTLTKKGKEYVTASGKSITATKGFQYSLQEQWATTEVLNGALGKYNDQSTKLGRKAAESATEVRTFTAFMDTLKESFGSGWASIFTSLFGNLEQATTFWTGLSGAVGGAVQKFFGFLSTSLKVWRSMGGFEKTMQGFKNLLAPFGAILSAIGDAWKTAFPNSGAGSGKALYGLSAGFEAVTRPLQLLADLIRGTTPFLTVFFQALKIGGTIIGRVAGNIADFVKDLIGLADINPSGGGFLKFIKDIAKAIGDAVSEIDDLLSKGASLTEAFSSVDVKLPSMPSLPSLPSISSIGGGDAGGVISSMKAGVQSLTGDVKNLNAESAQSTQKGLFSGDDVMGVLKSLGDFVVKIKDGIVSIFDNFSAEDAVAAFNTAIFATMGISIAHFINTMRKSFEGFMGIGEAFNSLIGDAGSALKSFQTQAKAKLILNIAIALLLLAGALFIISKIPADQLVKALAALGATAFIMSKTMGSMGKTIEKLDGAKAGVKMIGISIAVLALSFAMIALATAFLIFNKVDTKSVVKGLATMFVAMKLIEQLGKLSEGAHKNLIGGAFAILAVSGAMLLLAGALLLFKLVDWGSMAKAGTALAGVTLAVGLLALIPYAGIAKVGVALLAASAGMLAMANALVIFGFVKWESIGKAAVTLGILTIALAILMAVGNPVAISGLLGMAGAMVLLAGAMMVLNGVEWASIGKLALVFTVLSVALLAFTGIMYLMAPVVPVVLLFGLALLALGVGMMAFAGAMAIAISLGAAGVAAFAALATGAAVAVAVFLQTLAAEAPVMKNAFLKILQALIDTMVEAVPMIIQGIKDMWTAIKKEFTSDDKKKATGDAGKSWIDKLVDGIKAKIPAVVKKAAELLVTFIKALSSKASAIASAGVGLIVAVINGISKKIGDITNAAVDLIIRFATGIKNGLVKIVTAGIQLIGSFLHDLASAIRNSSGVIGGGLKDVIDAFFDVGVDMINGIGEGFKSLASKPKEWIEDVVGQLPKWAKKLLGISSPSKVFAEIGKFLVMGLAKGITDHAALAIYTVAHIVGGQIAIADSMVSLYLQRLEQQALAAHAKADGLRAAAARAQAAANKTKTKTDDKAANKISREAKQAAAAAKKADQKVAAEQKKKARQRQWENADSLERAKIKAQDAQSQINGAKAAEKNAAAARIEAAALEKQAKAAGVTPAQAKAMRKEAARLRKEAREEALRANKLLAAAQNSAADALVYQTKAGEEASKSFQEQFDAAAKADADQEAFDKMSDAEKAKVRRDQAALLQEKAARDLAKAKELAFTDIEKANAMADLAMEEADLARQYLDEAMGFDPTGIGGTNVNLQPTEAAALAFNQYADLYDAAYAAAAATPSVEFNQYNTSPESLSDTEIYRQTNNLVTYAADKLQPTP